MQMLGEIDPPAGEKKNKNKNKRTIILKAAVFRSPEVRVNH
jgi:hypothetical protein